MMLCKHEDAVMWNPFNKVVQCHRCGIIFVPEGFWRRLIRHMFGR